MNNQLAAIHMATIAGLTLLGAATARAGTALAEDPCGGPSTLLATLDRPTVGDSSCVVAQGRVVLEAGIQRGALSATPGGHFATVPDAELRFGLSDQNELAWLPPNLQYQHNNAGPGSAAGTAHGFGATTLGLKHQIGYSAHWQETIEDLATAPSGSSLYGSHGWGNAASGIVSYSSGGPFGLSLMLGISSQTAPTAAGGNRFNSINPDIVVTWLSNPRLQFYGEVYGQNRTAYGQGSGFDADGGVQYLLDRKWEVDLEEGFRLHGELGGFARYTGIGLGTLF
ncbi:MAG: transporter [Sulfuricaulis sp.]